ncbi:MAG: hypothetical protein ACYDCN_08805 [Bacteroidia bacterium]
MTNLRRWLEAICGNNTGDYIYRECKLGWIESLIDQSTSAGVVVFVKQMGTHLQKNGSRQEC